MKNYNDIIHVLSLLLAMPSCYFSYDNYSVYQCQTLQGPQCQTVKSNLPIIVNNTAF